MNDSQVYRVERPFIHPLTHQPLAAGDTTELHPRQAKYWLLSGHLAQAAATDDADPAITLQGR